VVSPVLVEWGVTVAFSTVDMNLFSPIFRTYLHNRHQFKLTFGILKFSNKKQLVKKRSIVLKGTLHRETTIFREIKKKLHNANSMSVQNKEVIKEQPTSRNLSATATRVLQCTCPVAASRKDFSAIHTSTSPHLNSSHTCFY
jgi:hypothetical protein